MVHQAGFPSLSENGTRVSTKKYSTPKTKVLSARDKLVAAKERVKKIFQKHTAQHIVREVADFSRQSMNVIGSSPVVLAIC